MKPSPLEFAREFEKLKSDLSRLPAADLKLLQLVRFWERLAPVAGKAAYESYLNDYRSLVNGLVQVDALSDLTIDYLNRVRHVLSDLVAVSGVKATETKLLIAASAVTLRLATLYFYVGAYDEGLALCLELKGGDDIALPTESEIRGLSPLDTLRTIYDKYRRNYPELGTMLQGILAKWEEDALAVEHDRVWCLFVDKDGKGNAATGRMRLLRGTVEQVAAKRKGSSPPSRGRQMSTSAPEEKVGGRQTPSSAPAPDTKTPRRVGAGLPPTGDMVAFDNQIKTPDDPFIGVAYESLKAVRLGLRSAGFARQADDAFRAFLSIEQSDRTFTGDSIGLAAALLSFTQLLKPEVMRHDRFIASDIAVTGSINADGQIRAVNDSTITTKIERAFFSHVRYVVLPEANLATARDTVKRLSKQYPRRRLSVIHVAHFDELIGDRNVIRSEKVCLGAFITKKAARYSRATKVQVPLLLLLLYALTCILFPKAWVGFDWNPRFVQVTDRGFVAMNKDSLALWEKEYECNSITVNSRSEVGDLNGDGKNEVAFAPKSIENSICECNAYMFVYDDNGDLLFRRDCVILDQYPGDSSRVLSYSPGDIDFTRFRDSIIIVSRATMSNPARFHLKFWNASGDSLGWYINAGYSGGAYKCFSSELETGLAFMVFNNRQSCVALFCLDPYSSCGVSPPYSDPMWKLENVKHGNQLCYVLFPRTDVNIATECIYNLPADLVVQSDGAFEVHVVESLKPLSEVWYVVDDTYRLLDVRPDDSYRNCRASFVNQGKLPPVDWAEYLANLRDTVTYWTDSGWVTEGEFRAAEEL